MSRVRQIVLGSWDSRSPTPKRRHGLTPAEQEQLKAGGCAICGRYDRPLQIDHDHRHHAGPVGCRHCVRGALCNVDNLILRWINDDPKIADAIAAYQIGRAHV